VKAEDVAGVRVLIENYKRFRALTTEWVDLSLEIARRRKAGGGDGD
jgi:hypothetical protein